MSRHRRADDRDRHGRRVARPATRRAVRQAERSRTRRRGRTSLRAGLLAVPVIAGLVAWFPGRLPGGDPVTEFVAGEAPSTSSNAGNRAGMAPLSSDSAPPRRAATTARSARPTPSPTRTATPSATRTARSASPATARGLRAGEQTLTDVAYADGSDAQRLDLYLPRRTGTAVPLVIVIHGGAFESGDKESRSGQAEALRAKGYAVASLDYRLSGEAPFPAGVQDVKAAVRWLRANSARYGIHPNRFAAWGESAGGYLAVMLGVTGGRRTVLDDPALGNASVSSAVQVVVDLFGPGDFRSMDAQAADPEGCPGGSQVHDAADSPESRWLGAPVQSATALAKVSNPHTYLASAPRLPVFVVAHGKQDCTVPFGQSVQLAAALRRAGAKVTLEIREGAGHSDPSLSDDYAPGLAAISRAFGD